MNNRIKTLRKALGLTQQEFADKIGVKQTTVAGYENGARTPISAVISSIDREFNVREEWLRTGEGEMFVRLTRNDEIARFVGSALAGEDDSFKKRLISMLFRLNGSDWAVLEKMLLEMQKDCPKVSLFA